MRRALLVLLATLASGAAWGGPHRDAVMDLLNAFESSATRAELEALGEGVDAELMEIAADASVATSRRGRAVSALAWYPTPVVLGFLESQLDKHDKGLIRRKAAYALAEGWGDKAVPALAKAIADTDVQLRIAVANALGTVGSESAQAALKARLDAEQDPAVREAIEKSLGGGR